MNKVSKHIDEAFKILWVCSLSDLYSSKDWMKVYAKQKEHYFWNVWDVAGKIFTRLGSKNNFMYAFFSLGHHRESHQALCLLSTQRVCPDEVSQVLLTKGEAQQKLCTNTLTSHFTRRLTLRHYLYKLFNIKFVGKYFIASPASISGAMTFFNTPWTCQL